MKALSLKEPWATLVALGAKHFETRSWRSHYRGPLAIHASAGKLDANEIATAARPAFRDALHGHQMPIKPAVIAVCQLVDVVRIVDLLPDGSLKEHQDSWVAATIAGPLAYARLPPGAHAAEREEEFGNYTPGRWAWILTDVRRLREPVRYKGALSVWELPDHLITPDNIIERG